MRDETTPNKLHPHDVKNRRKHAKMIRRIAIHPRAGMQRVTVSYRNTGELISRVVDKKTAGWMWRLRSVKSIRNTDWCA